MLQSTAALLSETWSFLLVRWRTVGIGIVSFTMLLAVNQAYFARQIGARMDAVQQQAGLTDKEFEQGLVALLRVGAPQQEVDVAVEALRESMITGRPMESFGFTPSKQNAALYFVITTMPLVFGLAIVGMLILFVSCVFYMIVGIQDARGAYDAFRKLPQKLMQISLLIPWIFFRGFIWVPVVLMLAAALTLPPAAFTLAAFAGLVACAMLLSRHALAPFMLIAEQHGVRKSTSLGFQRTKGIMLPILGSFVTLFLFLLLALWLASGVVDVISAFLPRAGFLVWLFTMELAVAFAAIFHVRMARGVIMGRR